MADEIGKTSGVVTSDASDSADQVPSELPTRGVGPEEGLEYSAVPSDPNASSADSTPAAKEATPGDGSSEQDPGQPYLFVDLYSGDEGRLVGKRPNWQGLATVSGFFGAILKAWDGTRFNDGGWFQQHWPAVRDAGGEVYGNSWFRGAYLFLELLQDGAQQADAYLKVVDAAGGWDRGDILPIIDVEQGTEGRPAMSGKPAVPAHPNRGASKRQVIDCVTACANRIKESTGRRVILYGRGAIRDLGIKDRMGCDLVWNPAYTPTMVLHGLEAWNLEDVVLWQYCGDGTAAVANLPSTVPGFGTCDLSVFVKGTQIPTLPLVRDNLLR
jgi:GH25 family lysozyme M1 (1,4-beta-N-acetylmuramidase)